MSHYARHAFFCTNQRDGRACCQDHQADDMRQRARDRVREAGETGPGGVRVNAAACLGRCAEGPVVVVYPEGVWYTYLSPEDVDRIVDRHLLAGEVVPDLRI